MRAPHLRPVDPLDLPDYPDALRDPSLTSDYFTKFWHDRWLSSRAHLCASMTVQGAMLNLFFYARKQTPVGSLPSDHAVLARLLRVSETQWLTMMDEPITPLHHWTEYQFGGEIVLGHPVVIEVALDALDRREARKASNEERAVRERRRRLVALMRELNCSEAVCKDDRLVGWLDDWLQENHRGRRQRPQIDASLGRAMKAAASAGVLNTGR
jgi:hypothetical protein